MKPLRDPEGEAERREKARRTVVVLALVAAGIYGYFIVKTFLHHAGAAP